MLCERIETTRQSQARSFRVVYPFVRASAPRFLKTTIGRKDRTNESSDSIKVYDERWTTLDREMNLSRLQGLGLTDFTTMIICRLNLSVERSWFPSLATSWLRVSPVLGDFLVNRMLLHVNGIFRQLSKCAPRNVFIAICVSSRVTVTLICETRRPHKFQK